MANKLKNLDDNGVAKTMPEDYGPALETIVNKIKDAQARAIRAVNFELVSVYRDIGQTIHEKQSRSEWGASVVERLAMDLKNSFPGIKGFSSRNLWIMRDLYVSYQDHEKLQTLSAEISWSHNVAILSKCQDRLEREFYIRMSKRNGWSYRTLLNHIENKTFEKMMTSQENFEANLPITMSREAKISIRDEYAFDFLELGDEHSERELERAVGKNIESFLREVEPVRNVERKRWEEILG